MSKHPPRTVTTTIQQPPALLFPQAPKRARSENDDIGPSDKSPIKRSKRVRLEVQQNLDLDHCVNVAIGRMDTHFLADYVAQHTTRFQAELSSVELEDLHIPGTVAYWIFSCDFTRSYRLLTLTESAFQETSDWPKPRLLEHLSEFLDHYSSLSGISKNLATASKKPGSPHTLVIVSAGLRAANVARLVLPV